MTLPTIIGDGVIPEAEAVRDVQRALGGRGEVVLLSHVAGVLKQPIPAGSILYNLEPLYDGCRSLTLGYLDVLRAHTVWDYQANNVEYLRVHGINARHVPYGWTPALERAPTKAKDIDVLFFGSTSPRRDAILSTIKGLVTAQGVYGAELDTLIARAKVVVNVHFTDHPHPLEVVRLAYLMANGCAVVSERGWDDEENEQYEPGLVFSDDLAEDCAELVNDDGLRAYVSTVARRTIRGIPFRVPS